mgnify:CR=1 FL=1
MSQKKTEETTNNTNNLKVSFTPNQQLWYQTPATEVLIGGSFGSGKSFFLRWASILWAMEIPGINIFLFRRTFPDLRINHLVGPQSYLSILEPLISGGWVKYNSAHNTFKFWNGSIITMSHLQQESDMYRFQGSEIHCLLIDEGTTFTEAQYRFMRSRVRMSGVKIPEKWKNHFPRIVTSSNPGGISHNFFKLGFVDLCPNNRIVKMPDDEGGLLTNRVKRKPFSVVLFDEVEKAHPDVFNLFLQLLDDGRLTDSSGATIDFCNTIIIMTSNLGAKHIRPCRTKDETLQMNAAIMDEVRSFFRPEFLNRIDDVTVFNQLAPEVMTTIVDIQLKKLGQVLKNKKLSLNLSDDARMLLAERGYNPEYGARPLARTIQSLLQDPLAEGLIAEEIVENSEIIVERLGDQLILNPDAALKQQIEADKAVRDAKLADLLRAHRERSEDDQAGDSL